MKIARKSILAMASIFYLHAPLQHCIGWTQTTRIELCWMIMQVLRLFHLIERLKIFLLSRVYMSEQPCRSWLHTKMFWNTSMYSDTYFAQAYEKKHYHYLINQQKNNDDHEKITKISKQFVEDLDYYQETIRMLGCYTSQDCDTIEEYVFYAKIISNSERSQKLLRNFWTTLTQQTCKAWRFSLFSRP